MNTKITTKEYIIYPTVIGKLEEPVLGYKVAGAEEESNTVLENYFNDIYHLFLHKLVAITHQSALSDNDEKKLKELFYELLKTKQLLQNSN